MLKRLMRASVGLPLILAVLVVTVPLSGCGLRQPPASARANVPVAPRVPSGSEKFAKATDKLEEALQAASRGYAKGSVDGTALAEIRAFSGELTKLDRGVRADFAKTRKMLKKVDSPKKDAIQERVERQYEQRSETLARKLYDIEQARGAQETSVAVAALSSWLNEVNPEPPAQTLGTQLPHRIVDYQAGSPVLGAAVAPAYAPNTPGAVPSTMPVEPTAGDLAETTEVQFSPEIRSLATSLSNDPVLMYEWVRNNIDFEPYFGSRKGATETLLEGSGNDMDTAALLVSLFRVSGIPARFINGNASVPIQRAMNLVGAGTADGAAALFQSGGTPAKLIQQDGEPSNLQVDHTWVEVYVGSSEYRGVGRRSGRPTSAWTPLDASIKDYRELSRLDPASVVPTEALDTFAAAMEQAAYDRNSTALSLDGQALDAAIRRLTSEVESSLAAADEAHELVTIIGNRSPIPQAAAVLPSSLPFRVNHVFGERQALPSNVVERLRLSLVVNGETQELGDEPLSAIGEQPIVLSFEPATKDDEAARSAYAQAEDVPAYLVNLVPRISLGSRTRAFDLPARLGEPGQLIVEIEGPSGHTRLCETPVTVGGYYSVGLDLGRVSQRRLDESADDFTDVAQRIGRGQLDTPVPAARFIGGMLHAGALTYFRQVDSSQDVIARVMGVRRFRQTSGLVTGTLVEPINTLGLTTRVNLPGLMFDVGTDASSRVGLSASTPTVLSAYGLVAGAAASQIEGALWHRLLGGNSYGASTVTVMRNCVDAGSAVLFVDETNVDQALASTAMRGAVEEEIRAAVLNGRKVVLPTIPLLTGKVASWGYLVIDPETGDSANMLSGGLAGGISGWEAGEMAGWMLIGQLTGVATLAGSPIGSGVETAVYLTAILSLGMSLASGVSVVNHVDNEANRSLYLAGLTGAFVTAFAGLTTIYTMVLASEHARPDSWLASPVVLAAFTVVSFVIAFSFWMTTVIFRLLAEDAMKE